jgi:hypothetical protein
MRDARLPSHLPEFERLIGSLRAIIKVAPTAGFGTVRESDSLIVYETLDYLSIRLHPVVEASSGRSLRLSG